MSDTEELTRPGIGKRVITDGFGARQDLAFSHEELQMFASAHEGAGESFSDIETTGLNKRACAITQFSCAKPVKDGSSEYQMLLLDIFMLPYKPVYQEYLTAKAAYERDPDNHPEPVYDRSLYEYEIDSGALAVTGTHFEREDGDESPITGMWLEPRDDAGNIIKRVRIDEPCQTFSDALPDIERFIVHNHDLYYNAPFDKPFLLEKYLDVLAYRRFCEQRDNGWYDPQITDQEKASIIEDIRKELPRDNHLFSADPRSWQCLLHAYIAANPAQPSNRLDDAYRNLVDSEFTERSEHDAAEDIAMSAKVAFKLHGVSPFSVDIPDFTDIWKRLVQAQCADAEVIASDYHKAPFETRRHLRKLPDTIPAIHIHLPKNDQTKALTDFFSDMYDVARRSSNARDYILDLTRNDDGTDIWLNPAIRDSKPLFAALMSRFQLFTDVMATRDQQDAIQIKHLKWYDSVASCDVWLAHSEQVIEDVPLKSLQLNLAFLSKPSFTEHDRYELIELIRELGAHPLIGTVRFYYDKSHTLCVGLKGTVPGSGEMNFRLAGETNPLDMALDILTYIDGLAQIGLLQGAQEAQYELGEEDVPDLVAFANATIDSPKDDSPLRLTLSPIVSQLVKYQMGDRIKSYLPGTMEGAVQIDPDTGQLHYNGTLSGTSRRVKANDNDRTSFVFADALRNASWLHYRLSRVPDVGHITANEKSIHLHCRNGISERTLFTLYRAGVPFSITAEDGQDVTRITLNQTSLFRDAFNISKQLKEATADINHYYSSDNMRQLNGDTTEYLSRYEPDMRFLSRQIAEGSIRSLRMNSAGNLYFRTKDDPHEHRFIPPGQTPRLELENQEDGTLDSIRSSVMDPPVHIYIDQDNTSFIFKDNSPLKNWFEAWLNHRHIAFNAESGSDQLNLENSDDYTMAISGLASLSRHYYNLYRQAGNLPLISDLAATDTTREISIAQPSFPKDPTDTPRLFGYVNGLRRELETLDEALTDIKIIGTDLWQTPSKEPTFSISDRRESQSVTDLDAKLRPLEARLQTLDSLSAYVNAENGYQHAIEAIYHLTKSPPIPIHTPLKPEIAWLDQIREATEDETAIEQLDALITSLTLADNSIQRLHEAASQIEQQIHHPTHGLARLYCDVMLMSIPGAMANVSEHERGKWIKDQLKIWQKAIYEKNTKQQNENETEDEATERRAAQSRETLNHALCDHLLYWLSNDGMDEWYDHSGHIDVTEIIAQLLTDAYQPAFSENTARNLVGLFDCLAQPEALQAQTDRLMEEATPEEAQRLNRPPFGETFFDAILISRGVTTAEELGHALLEKGTASPDDMLRDARKARAKEYGYLLNHLNRQDPKDEEKIEQLRNTAMTLWKEVGLSDADAIAKIDKAQTRKQPYAQDNVDKAIEKDALVQTGGSALQRAIEQEPGRWMDCDGAKNLFLSQHHDKQFEKTQKYITDVVDKIPDPYRELKLKRRLISKHGHAHSGFIKEWNDFQLIRENAQIHLKRALELISAHPQIATDNLRQKPLYDHLRELGQTIQKNQAKAVEQALQADDLPFFARHDEQALGYSIDISRLIIDEPAKQPEEIKHIEETPEQQLESDKTLPAPIQQVLQPLQELCERFASMGDVSIPEITLQINANDKDQQIVLKAVHDIFNHTLIPMAEAMGKELAPEITYHADSGRLHIRCPIEQISQVASAARYVKEQHDALAAQATPKTQVSRDTVQQDETVDPALQAWLDRLGY